MLIFIQIRVENLKVPEEHIPEILRRVRKEYLQRTYELRDWTEYIDFLTQVAKRTGKLLKKGEPDLGTVAKMILNDWLRGKIPYYIPPPESASERVDKNKESDDEEDEVKVITNMIKPHVAILEKVQRFGVCLDSNDSFSGVSEVVRLNSSRCWFYNPTKVNG